jgi:hypothetical protein
MSQTKSNSVYLFHFSSMSLVAPQIYVGANWRLRDHDWVKSKNIHWVLKYVDKPSRTPVIEEVDSDEDDSHEHKSDYPGCTIMVYDQVMNEEPNKPLPTSLLDHLPQGIGFILMVKHLIKDFPDRSLYVCSPRGKSRAPAVVVASLILTQKAGAEEAVGHLMSQHTRTHISDSLLRQLGAFHQAMQVNEQQVGFYKRMTQYIEGFQTQLNNAIREKTQNEQQHNQTQDQTTAPTCSS